ncbi:MAG: outer membrane beta-barrel protein [Muribaculaceae bacterium]|nr:outer membrane beta-barrel protein [Muribaculaceae bacterium]
MKQFITLIVSILSLIAIAAPAANAQHGEKSVGLRAGYTTRNNTASAGLYFSYRFTEHFRIAPKIDYAFRHNKTDAFSFNFDTEYPIALNTVNTVNFYPIAGLNYSTYSTHTSVADSDESDDASVRESHFGLNLGAGVEYFATPTLRLSFESKCQLVKKYTGGWFTISIGYRF